MRRDRDGALARGDASLVGLRPADAVQPMQRLPGAPAELRDCMAQVHDAIVRMRKETLHLQELAQQLNTNIDALRRATASNKAAPPARASLSANSA